MQTLDLEHPDELLATIAKQLGFALVGWRATHSEPARNGNLLGFEVQLEATDGQRQAQTVFVETNADAEGRDGVLLFEQPTANQRIAVWIYPNDPALPALAATVFSESARALLARLGVTIEHPELSVLAYRPGKRAVIRVDGGDKRVYLKVVRPGKASAIVKRHASFLDAGIAVPHVIGWSEDGLIALTELDGLEAQRIASELDQEFLGQVQELAARVATVASHTPARESLVDRLDWYLGRLTTQLPDQKRRLRDLAGGIRQLLSEGRAGDVALVTIHGDLHTGQIFVTRQAEAARERIQITGLLDIDTAGLGDPADDSAAFYAHLHVLARHLDVAEKHETAQHVSTLAAGWRDRWWRDGDPGFAARARAIAATHFLGHALRQGDTDGVESMITHATGMVLREAT